MQVRFLKGAAEEKPWSLALMSCRLTLILPLRFACLPILDVGEGEHVSPSPAPVARFYWEGPQPAKHQRKRRRHGVQAQHGPCWVRTYASGVCRAFEGKAFRPLLNPPPVCYPNCSPARGWQVSLRDRLLHQAVLLHRREAVADEALCRVQVRLSCPFGLLRGA